MHKTIVSTGQTPQAAAGTIAPTTFAGANGLLTPVEVDFVARPGRKTTNTESDG